MFFLYKWKECRIGMFEDLILFAVILLVNVIVCAIVYRKRQKLPLIWKIFGVVGIFIHEISHLFMCVISGVTPTSFKISYRHLHGSVSVKDYKRLSFLQAFMCAIAPLLIMSYLACYCLMLFFEPAIKDIYRIFAGFAFVSIITGASPSRADLRFIGYAFNNDPLYSLYQVGLVILSGVVIYLIFFQISIPYYLSFVWYICIGIGYYVVKYLFLGVRKLGEYLLAHMGGNRRRSIRSSELYRKRHKPQRKKKDHIERGQW